MTVTLDEAIEAARSRAELVTGLADLIAWLVAHPGSPVPDVHASFRVPGERGRQLSELEDIAHWLGAAVTDDGTGTLIASRMFGPVPVEAHLDPDDDYARRAALLGLPPFDDMLATASNWVASDISVARRGAA